MWQTPHIYSVLTASNNLFLDPIVVVSLSFLSKERAIWWLHWYIIAHYWVNYWFWLWIGPLDKEFRLIFDKKFHHFSREFVQVDSFKWFCCERRSYKRRPFFCSLVFFNRTMRTWCAVAFIFCESNIFLDEAFSSRHSVHQQNVYACLWIVHLILMPNEWFSRQLSKSAQKSFRRECSCCCHLKLVVSTNQCMFNATKLN